MVNALSQFSGSLKMLKSVRILGYCSNALMLSLTHCNIPEHWSPCRFTPTRDINTTTYTPMVVLLCTPSILTQVAPIEVALAGTGS
ncbi:hypothetical protein YC2023_052239 [Brassica napus]